MDDVTTIKVPKAVRDVLQERARRDRRSMASVIEAMLAESARAERFAQLKAERAGSRSIESGYDEEWEVRAVTDIAEDGA